MDGKVLNERWLRWSECSLCEQRYHGVVHCALGWACWKTYLERPETDQDRIDAMMELGNGLHDAGKFEDALSVREAELSMRLDDSEHNILAVQSNLANSYDLVGRREEATRLRRDVYSARLKLDGEEHEETLRAANNLAVSLKHLRRFEETKTLLRNTIPVARRVLGEGNNITLRMRWTYARALSMYADATLDDLREAVATLEDAGRIAQRVLGGANPLTVDIEAALRAARKPLRTAEERVKMAGEYRGA